MSPELLAAVKAECEAQGHSWKLSESTLRRIAEHFKSLPVDLKKDEEAA